MGKHKQTKAEGEIAELKRRILALEAQVATLAARPTVVPYYPSYPYPYTTYSSGAAS